MKKYIKEIVYVPTDDDELKLVILKPTVSRKTKDSTPGILWIHGGGYVGGNTRKIASSRAGDFVKKYGAVVVAPEYRLAGKAPYPAALEDCYIALQYLRDHADELGCSSEKIMVGGESAGGGLTVALCMYARDWGDVNIAFQMPLYPMLDDRENFSNRNNNSITWNSKRNRKAWDLYLENVVGDPPSYAVPARQMNYADLPPAYSFVGEKEIFYTETMRYIDALKNDGVQAHADVYPTRVHAFDITFPFTKVSKQAIAELEKQYLYAAEHYSAPQRME